MKYGEISSYPEGYKENAGIFCHNNPWIMIAGKDSHTPGQAKNSWLTGTAAWYYYAVTQYILGIRPEYEGLRIQPVIPSQWKGYQVIRRFREATYHIAIANPHGAERAIRSIPVNGEELKGTLVQICIPGSVNRVDVVMG